MKLTLEEKILNLVNLSTDLKELSSQASHQAEL
jgi:hypothetical protein